MAEEYKAGNVEARNRIIASAMPFVVRAAKKFLLRTKDVIDDNDADDLCQFAAVRLLKAFDAWDASYTRFLTYVGPTLWHHFSVYGSRNSRNLKQITFSDIVDDDKKETFDQALNITSPIDDDCDIESFQEHLLELRRAVGFLPERLKMIYGLRLDGYVLEDIAAVEGVSKERIRQLLDKAEKEIMYHVSGQGSARLGKACQVEAKQGREI